MYIFQIQLCTTKKFQNTILIYLYQGLLISLLQLMHRIIPHIDTVIPVFHLINFCFIFIIIATIDVGTKNIRFAPCAMCWSFPKNRDRHSISIVPPPMPIPLTIPETIPIKIFTILATYSLNNKSYTNIYQKGCEKNS